MNIDRYHQLTNLAKDLHWNQQDHAGRPYWQHCLRVVHICASILAARGYDIADFHSSGANDKIIITALFHDVLEDVPDGAQKLAQNLHEDEARLAIDSIRKLTRPQNLDYLDYIAAIVACNDTAALLVKFADLIDHVECLPLVDDVATRERLAAK